MNRSFSTEDIDKGKKHTKRCLRLSVITEMQIKTTKRCHHTPIRTAKIKKKQI